jgi:hypothetical protein
MQETTHEIISGTPVQDRTTEPPVRVENLVVKPGTMEISLLAEPYEPCEGTWKEFVSDLKRTCLRIGAEVKGRSEVVKDSWENTFRRNRRQPVNLPK